MRIVTKTNLALVGVVAVSAFLNFAVLEWTIMPRFLDIETEAATRNQSRAMEAIQVQEDQVAASARDYAFWDDSYAFMQGRLPDYEDKNVSAESLKALSVNYFLAVDGKGRVELDRGFDFSSEEPTATRLLTTDDLPPEHAFRRIAGDPQSQQGLLRTDKGIVAVGYAPILTSERAGPALGTLMFGKVLDLDALRRATKVDFDLVPLASDIITSGGIVEGADTIETRTVLGGVNGRPLAVLTSKTDRLISSAGRQAIWVAMSLLAAGGALLIVTLAVLLRRIVIARIEAVRSHLVTVTSTGSLEPLPIDGHGDELSETVASFNRMAAQLAELREAVRRQDYNHGAADQAAGILHNLRNAVSPINTITWDLLRDEDAPWKQNLAKAVDQLAEPALPPERSTKLNQFVALSAAKLLDEGTKRKANLEALGEMVRHVDRILKDEDAVAQRERVVEEIDLAACAATAAGIVKGRSGITFAADLSTGTNVVGHKIALEQVLANLVLNAAEAIGTNRADGTVSLTVHETQLNGAPALDIRVQDNGAGIPVDHLERIFEKGFSTRRERSSGLGLHWCANAVTAMRGRLYAESEGVGRGATLHVVLPSASMNLKEAA